MKKNFFPIVIAALVAIFTVSCVKDKDEDEEKGTLNVKVTDAPSDDVDISSVFVTVSMIKVDGAEVEGFQKQTFDISSFSEGTTKLLLTQEINAQTYNSISLVLDYETDDNGASPGCYVLTTDNQKHNLAASSGAQAEIMFNKEFMVEANQTQDLIIDLDLRKAIVRDIENESSDYAFVSETNLHSASRLIIEDEAGSIEGEVDNNSSLDLEFIVYAYKKGEYSFLAETQAENSGGVMFSHAVTSVKVKENGDYHLSFLEEGEYEIHIASFARSSTTGELNFTGMAIATSLTQNVILDEIMVTADQEVDIDISITIST